jgi:sugar-specific transcriptional regulator TrmB
MHEEMLVRLGLNMYEARVYETLCRIGPSKVARIAKESRVPRTRLYDVLGTLLGKNWITIVSESPLAYKANPPETKIRGETERQVNELKAGAEKSIDSLGCEYERSSTVALFIKPTICFRRKAEVLEQLKQLLPAAKIRIIFDSIPVWFLREIDQNMQLPHQAKIWYVIDSSQKLPKEMARDNAVVVRVPMPKENTGYVCIDGRDALILHFFPDEVIAYRIMYPKCRVCLNKDIEEEVFGLKKFSGSSVTYYFPEDSSGKKRGPQVASLRRQPRGKKNRDI